MGYACCVLKCKTGYHSIKRNKSESTISLFRIPLDPLLCQKWIRAIPQENLNVIVINAEFVPNVLLSLIFKL